MRCSQYRLLTALWHTAAAFISQLHGVVWWRSGYGNRSQVQVLTALLHLATLGKLFTHTCLCSPSSVNWYQHNLELNRHSTWHISLVFHGLTASAGVWLRAMETEISTTLWARVAWEGLHGLELAVSLFKRSQFLYQYQTILLGDRGIKV